MKPRFIVIVAVLVLIPIAQDASAINIPDWVKDNAGWWADGVISDAEFIAGIEFLIKDNIIVVPSTTVAVQQSNEIPEWIKSNAAWWSQGIITSGEFVSGIQYLITNGIITIHSSEDKPVQTEESSVTSTQTNSQLDKLEANLELCAEIKKAYERLNCEKDANGAIVAYDYKVNGQSFEVGPVTFYYKGNEFEIRPSGQAILSITMLAENSGSSDNVAMMCTGPSICNYDVWNGDKVFKYSAMDFTNGQIVLQPEEATEFSMLFGPNIGYGGTKFEYDPSKDYFFRISEPWGSANIPLDFGQLP